MLQVSFSSPSVEARSSERTDSPLVPLKNCAVATMEQTHSDHVEVVTSAQNQYVADCDGLITQVPNVELRVKHADCLPILLYHQSGVVAAVHAGRKGTQEQIIGKILETLKTEFNISDSLEIWFGPAICKDCYQIDRTTDLHFDLVAENTQQIRLYFSEQQASITYCNRCTAHENNHFYSYRKEGTGVPMNWSGIALLTSKA